MFAFHIEDIIREMPDDTDLFLLGDVLFPKMILLEEKVSENIQRVHAYMLNHGSILTRRGAQRILSSPPNIYDPELGLEPCLWRGK